MAEAAAVPAPELLTREQVAGFLGISVSMVDKLRAGGKLRVVKLGKRLPRFRKADIERFLDQRTEQAEPPPSEP